MSLQLSGYLGGEKVTNLPQLAEDLVAAFDRHRAEHDDSAILIPVVGIIRVESVKYPRDPDAEPTVGVKFAALEVPEGADVETIRTQWRQCRDKRLGDIPLDLEWGDTAAEDREEGTQDGQEDADGFHDPGAAPGSSTAAVDFSDAKSRRGRGKTS